MPLKEKIDFCFEKEDGLLSPVVEYMHVSYYDDEGDDQSSWGLFWRCHKDHIGTFPVTRLGFQ